MRMDDYDSMMKFNRSSFVHIERPMPIPEAPQDLMSFFATLKFREVREERFEQLVKISVIPDAPRLFLIHQKANKSISLPISRSID